MQEHNSYSAHTCRDAPQPETEADRRRARRTVVALGKRCWHAGACSMGAEQSQHLVSSFTTMHFLSTAYKPVACLHHTAAYTQMSHPPTNPPSVAPLHSNSPPRTGTVFAVLLVLTIVTSGPSTPQQQQPPASLQQQDWGHSHVKGGGAAGGVWNEHGSAPDDRSAHSASSGIIPCEGLPPLACGIVNPKPLPSQDFRGLPRRLEVTKGVVAADSSRCSEIGARMLEEGGHAVDAAVATALCLGVVNPISSGLVSVWGVGVGEGAVPMT